MPVWPYLCMWPSQWARACIPAEYLVQGAASIVQVDVAPIGGITPWLKVAALSTRMAWQVAPHFLMELHLSSCAVPNARWLELPRS